MNDLDELLREDGRTWQAPPASPLDLDAALARSATRRSRLGAGAALVVVVALAAGGALLLRGGGIPAVPAPIGTPSAPVPTSSAQAPSPTAPASSATPTIGPSDPAIGRTLHDPPTRQELAEVVRDTAVQLGIPAKVDAVTTTLGRASSLLDFSWSGIEAQADKKVWVVQVQGEFSCGPCTPTQTGPEAGVPTLQLVLDAGDLHRLYLSEGGGLYPLETLGEVTPLDPEADR